VSVPDPDTGDKLHMYLRTPNTKDFMAIQVFLVSKQLASAGAVVIETCWLAGDAELKDPNSKFYPSATIAAAGIVQLYEHEVVKL